MFHTAGKVVNTGHGAVVLPVWLLKLHTSPQPPSKLCAATEAQGSNLNTYTPHPHHTIRQELQREVHFYCALNLN